MKNVHILFPVVVVGLLGLFLSFPLNGQIDCAIQQPMKLEIVPANRTLEGGVKVEVDVRGRRTLKLTQERSLRYQESINPPDDNTRAFWDNRMEILAGIYCAKLDSAIADFDFWETNWPFRSTRYKRAVAKYAQAYYRALLADTPGGNSPPTSVFSIAFNSEAIIVHNPGPPQQVTFTATDADEEWDTFKRLVEYNLKTGENRLPRSKFSMKPRLRWRVMLSVDGIPVASAEESTK